MQIQYNGKSKILRRIVELVNRSQNIALRQDNTDKNTLYWTGLDGVEITVNIPSGAVEVDAELSETSTNPVENQAITKELAQKADKSAIPTVGNGVLSVQRNGKSVGTFSANAAKDTAVNIPVPEKVSELENDAGYGTYTKPATGIPKSDLASGVQASLGKADTALQKHQDISGKLDKTGDASSTTVAFSAASARENVKTGEKLSVIVGKIAKWFADLKTVAFTGSYNDLANKPTIPDGSKYLPLAGGKMTGDIDMQTNKRDILVGTQKANTSDGTVVAGGAITTPGYVGDKLKAARSFVGTVTGNDGVWWDVISVRHRNGHNDGVNYGMYLFSKLASTGNLSWNKQTAANNWQGDRTLLDSVNYTNYALAKDGTAKKAELLSSGQMRSAYGHNDDATFSNGYVWFKIGTATLSSGYATVTTTFLGICGYGKHALYTCRVRLTSAGNAVESITFLESGRTGGMLTGLFRIVAINGEKNVTFELWAKGASRWEGTRIVILNEMNLAGGGQGNFWTLTSRGNADAKTAPTSGNMYVNSSDSSICATAARANEATTLTDSGWVAMTLGSYAASGTVQYRTYGKQITITGKVVLKSEIRTNYHAPQSIANTKLDFSKIKGCSGFGRSSTGTGVYVRANRFGDDNIVDVFSIGSNIAAGATLYFTITGFID